MRSAVITGVIFVTSSPFLRYSGSIFLLHFNSFLNEAIFDQESVLIHKGILTGFSNGFSFFVCECVSFSDINKRNWYGSRNSGYRAFNGCYHRSSCDCGSCSVIPDPEVIPDFSYVSFLILVLWQLIAHPRQYEIRATRQEHLIPARKGSITGEKYPLHVRFPQ